MSLLCSVKHGNFPSLVRQLNMYGFSKITPSQGIKCPKTSPTHCWQFRCANFVRDQPHLLAGIFRRPPPPVVKKRRSSGVGAHSSTSETPAARRAPKRKRSQASSAGGDPDVSMDEAFGRSSNSSINKCAAPAAPSSKSLDDAAALLSVFPAEAAAAQAAGGEDTIGAAVKTPLSTDSLMQFITMLDAANGRNELQRLMVSLAAVAATPTLAPTPPFSTKMLGPIFTSDCKDLSLDDWANESFLTNSLGLFAGAGMPAVPSFDAFEAAAENVRATKRRCLLNDGVQTTATTADDRVSGNMDTIGAVDNWLVL